MTLDTDLFTTLDTDLFIEENSIQKNAIKTAHDLKCNENWNFLEYEFVNEACNPYKFNALIESKKEPGKEVKITIGEEEIHLKIISCSLLKRSSENNQYIIFAAHNSELLKYKSNCRIFQDKTLEDIIKKVAGRQTVVNLTAEVKVSLFVQYEENDFSFLNRLLNFYNCFWFCKPDGEIIVFDILKKKEVTFKEEQVIFIKKQKFNLDSEIEVASYNDKDPNVSRMEKEGKGSIHRKYFKQFDKNESGKKIAKYIFSQNMKEYNIFTINLKELKKIPKIFDTVTIVKEKYGIIQAIKICNDTAQIKLSHEMPCLKFTLPKVPHFFKSQVVGEKQLDYVAEKIKIFLPFETVRANEKTKVNAKFIQASCTKNNQKFFMPAKNDEVLASFLDTNLTEIVIVGCIFNVANKCQFNDAFGYMFQNENGAKTEISMNKLNDKVDLKILNEGKFQMECGDNISIQEKKGELSVKMGEEKIEIENKKGNLIIKIAEEIDLTCKKLNIKTEETNFSADKKILFKAKEIDFKADKEFKVEIDSTSLSMQSSGIKMKSSSSTIQISENDVTIKSGSSLKISMQGVSVKGEKVDLTGASGIKLESSQIKITGDADIKGLKFAVTAASVEFKAAKFAIACPKVDITAAMVSISGVMMAAAVGGFLEANIL